MATEEEEEEEGETRYIESAKRVSPSASHTSSVRSSFCFHFPSACVVVFSPAGVKGEGGPRPREYRGEALASSVFGISPKGESGRVGEGEGERKEEEGGVMAVEA